MSPRDVSIGAGSSTDRSCISSPSDVALFVRITHCEPDLPVNVGAGRSTETGAAGTVVPCGPRLFCLRSTII